MTPAAPPARGELFTALSGVCGAEHVRPAHEQEALGGQRPGAVAAPADTAEAAALLRLAAARGLHVVARGTGSRQRWGNPPRRVDLIVDTHRMSAVLEHVAGDLVVRVQAGATLDEVQRHVAPAGQRLALDPAGGGSLGGIVATGASGPLRHRFGTARDLLIGSTVVLADGTTARSGGKVVKNVAGYDLGKLFTGSFGTLGVLTEVIFRLHPLPPVQRCLRLEAADPGAVGHAAAVVTSSQLVPSALELGWEPARGAGHLEVLFEGTRAGVDGQAAEAQELWRPIGPVREMPVPPSPAVPADEVLVKISHLPARLPAVLVAVREATAAEGLDLAVSGHAGVGVTYLRAPAGTAADRAAGIVSRLRADPVTSPGGVVLLQSPPAAPVVEDRWGPVAALALMRRVKDQFDPEHRLAAGRFVGGI